MKLLIIILLIIIIIYAYCYYIFPTEISILQTDLKNFNFNLLSSRQPIVISDFIQNPSEVINSWFNYNIINANMNANMNANANANANGNDNGNDNANANANDNDNGNDNGNDNDNDDWIHNNYKYLFINAYKDTEVIIYKAEITKMNPKAEDNIIIIKLQKNQSLILPFKWKYYSKNINKWGIDDLITFSFGRVF
jgi:hypothetical protein